MKLNRKWLLVIALVLSLTTAISGTLAYLTSTDSATNTFVVGNVSIDLLEPNWDTSKTPTLLPGVSIAKDPQIKNTGSTAAWVWMKITVPTDLMSYIDWSDAAEWTKTTTTSGTNTVVTMKRATLLPAGETTATAFTKVALPTTLTEMPASIATSGTVNIVVDAYAIQSDAATTIDAAIAAYNGETGDEPGGEGGEPSNVTEVSTADALTSALAAGGNVKLTADIELDTNTTITIASGNSATLDLNGHTLSSKNTRTATHNFMIDVNGGTLNISNGTVELTHTGSNMGWNGAATVIDVTAGGVLNLEDVTVENKGGTDMNFAVNLNNWGAVTMNANNCKFIAPYCSVRVFNSGADMNNVKITNSTLTGNKMAFWVHNYAESDLSTWYYADGTTGAYNKTLVDARLKLDIYNNSNTFTTTATENQYPAPIRYGFNVGVYYDATGNVVTE